MSPQWLTRCRIWVRRQWTRIWVAYRQWRRRRKAYKNRKTPLREFIYLDEVSVYSLNASRLGAIAAEFTDTETMSLQSGSGASISGNIGAAKAGTKTYQSSKETQQSQVVRRSIVQTTFREFYEYEKDHLATRPVPDEVKVPRINTIEDLEAKEGELKADGLIVDPQALVRGMLLEMEVKLETEKIFQFNTMLKELVEIIQENIALFGIDERSFNEGRSYGRIIEQLLAGLIPIRGLAVDYVRMVIGGRELIVHRRLSESLLTGGLSDENKLESCPLHVVGVTEETLYWKDIRRVLFSGTKFRVLCRLSQDGIRNSWTPIKMRDVLATMSPDLAQNIDTLSFVGLFDETNGQVDESAARRQQAMRNALLNYTTSLAGEYSKNLTPDDELKVKKLIERHQDSFESTTSIKEGFGTVAEFLAATFEVELDPNAEKRRRLMALDKAGLTLAGELEPIIEISDNDHSDLSQDEYLLDSEFIAIYW